MTRYDVDHWVIFKEMHLFEVSGFCFGFFLIVKNGLSENLPLPWKEMFHLTTHSTTHFIYGYMALGIW